MDVGPLGTLHSALAHAVRPMRLLLARRFCLWSRRTYPASPKGGCKRERQALACNVDLVGLFGFVIDTLIKIYYLHIMNSLQDTTISESEIVGPFTGFFRFSYKSLRRKKLASTCTFWAGFLRTNQFSPDAHSFKRSPDCWQMEISSRRRPSGKPVLYSFSLREKILTAGSNDGAKSRSKVAL